jgi:hypothetical protein
MKEVFAQLFQWRRQALSVDFGQKHGNELIAALADLPPSFIHSNLYPEMFKGSPPSVGMQRVAVYKGSVDITQKQFRHRSLLPLK